MKAVRAHVRNGQIVPDEPVRLIDGTAVEILMPESVDTDDHWVEMSPEEPAELEEALDESAAQIARGEYVDARAFALSLLSKPS